MGTERAQFFLNLILTRYFLLEWPSHSDTSQVIIHIKYAKQCADASADNWLLFTEQTATSAVGRHALW